MQDSLKGQPNEADVKAMQAVPNRGSVFEGIYVDGPAIFGSSVLLAVLLTLMLNQIFSFDRWIAKAKGRWREKQEDKEKWAVYNARQQFEKSMSSMDDSDDQRQ